MGEGKGGGGQKKVMLQLVSVHKFPSSVMPDLIRHPETLENTGFRLPFQGRGTVAGMTTLKKRAIYKQTLIRGP